MNRIDNSIIEIDLDKCTKCRACVNDCVARLFYIKEDELHIADDFVEYCILCGHCVAVCPMSIIRLKKYKDQPIKEISKVEDTPDFNRLHNLILNRRSIRQFKSQPISKETIKKILELARYSPTGSNTENIFYTVVQNKQIVTTISNYITDKMKRFVEALENPKGRELLKSRMPKAEYTLALENLSKTKAILKTIDKGIDFWCWNGELIFIHGDRTIGGIPTNTALAAANIMLAAETLGLGTCSLGYLTYHANLSHTIKELIHLPNDHEIGYSLAVGYPNVHYKKIPPRKPINITWL